MIEKAIIYGQIGKAVFKEDGKYFFINAKDIQKPLECNNWDFSIINNSEAEGYFLADKNITIEKVRQTLQLRRLAHITLYLMISGFDPELSEENRRDSIEDAEKWMNSDTRIHRFVRGRLLCRPLPKGVDIQGAISFAGQLGAHEAESLYKEVQQYQEAIKELLQAWQKVSLSLLSTDYQMAETERRLIEDGVFYHIISAISHEDMEQIERMIFQDFFPQYKEILIPLAEVLRAGQLEVLVDLITGKRQRTHEPYNKMLNTT